MNRLRTAVLALAVLAGAGCSGNISVGGRLVYPDGSPAKEFAGSTVELSPVGGVYGSRGQVNKDGTFTLSSDTPGDGTRPGKYKVVVHTESRSQD